MPQGKDTYVLVSLKEFVNLTKKAQQAVEQSSKSMQRHAKSTRSTFDELFESVRLGTDRFRLLALIGMGTLAMLFMNTPIMQAGFEMIKAALTMLFITMQDYVLPVLEYFAGFIKQINDELRRDEGLRELVAVLTAIGVGFAVLSAFLVPILLLVKTLNGALTALSIVWIKLGKRIHAIARAGLGVTLRGWLRLLGRFFLPLTIIIGLFDNWKEILIDFKNFLGATSIVFEGFKKVVKGIITLNFGLFLQGIKMMLKGAIYQFKFFFDFIIDLIEGILKGFDSILSLFGVNLGLASAWERFFNKLGVGTTVGDAIITPRGEVIRTSPDDWIIATKNPSLGTAITISFEGANIFLSDGFDLEDLADGIASRINDRLNLTR